MNLVVLCVRDSAGNMYNMCTAVNKYTKHKATMINFKENLYGYPTMLKKPMSNLPKIRKMIYDSDALVFKESHRIPKVFGIDLKKIGRKPVMVLLGGRGFRLEKLRKANLNTYKSLPNVRWAVTTTTFLKEFPDWTWIPRCVRFEEIRSKYDYTKMSPPLIATSPSEGANKHYKVLENFRQIVSALKLNDLKFQSMEICDKNNEKCLKLKAPASIFFDRIGCIYGINSQEAGAFESAVVTGTPRFALKKLEDFGFKCPFINVVDVEGAVRACKELLEDEAYRRHKGLECFKYVKQLHSGRESAKRLIDCLSGAG